MGMIRNFIILLIFLTKISYSQVIIYNDNFETIGFNWKGIPRININTTLFSNSSSAVDNPASQPFYTTPNNGFGLLGSGLGSSSVERDTISFPNLIGLNPVNQYKIKLRFCSFGLNPATNFAAGVDGTDFIQISCSYTGGILFSPELRITGASNSCWGFNKTGIVTKNSNGTLLTQSIIIGSEPTTMELNLPSGINQVALNVILSCNASGETWIIDDVQLLECQVALPVILGYANLKQDQDNFKLDWKTLSETNVDYYSIILLNDKGLKTEIGRVKAMGFSNLPTNYYFMGKIPNGLNYLILREIDYDGYFEDLKIFSIFWRNENDYTDILRGHNLIGQKIK